MDPHKLIAMLDNCSEEVADAATQELIKGHPNTYTFTKCCAEDLVKDAYESGYVALSLSRSLTLSLSISLFYISNVD